MPGPKPRQPKSKAAVIVAYRSGKTLKQVQEEFNISRATTLDILRCSGVSLRDPSTVHRDAQLKYMQRHPEKFRQDNCKMVRNSVAARKKQYSIRITTAISPEMHEQMKQSSAEFGEDLTEFVRESINRWLRSWRQTKKH